MGNMILGADKVGGVWTAKFNIFGKLNDIVDASEIAISSPGTIQPQVFLSNAFSINGTAEKISKWEFNLGNEVKAVPDQSDATGISHYVVVSKKPRFSCNPLGVKQATRDWWAEALSKPSTNNLILGTPAAAKLSISSSDMQMLSMAQSEVEGLSAWDMNFKLLPNGVPGTLNDAALTYEDTFELLQGTRT
jgi:hypothetical protein